MSPPIAAAVAELADALDSGSSGSKIPWRFDSSQPHLDYKPGSATLTSVLTPFFCSELNQLISLSSDTLA